MENTAIRSEIFGGHKSNKAFMLLSAFGILFVIDAHVWDGISFLSQIFPYDSFFMPMFIFISGYFFKLSCSESFGTAFKFTCRKFKGLMLPYFFWIAFYGVFTLLLRKAGIISFGSMTFKVLIASIFTSGSTFGFNSPAWFIPALFSVCVVYCMIRTLFSRIWNDAAATVVFIVIGAVAVCLSNTEFNNDYTLLMLKTAFFIQFYQLGISFKKYAEVIFDKMSLFLVCISAVLLNLTLLAVYGGNIRFPNCAFMSGFKTGNPILPLITSITGILFWLKISKALAPVFAKSRIMNFISDNTFFIMTNHLLFKTVFSGLLLVGKKCGLACFSEVNGAQIMADPWYVFSDYSWVKAAYFIFTLVSVLAACFIYNHIKNIMFQKIKVLITKL